MSSAAPRVLALACSDTKVGPWIDGLRAALPGWRVADWFAEPELAADYAVVWAPPQAFFDAQPRLKAVFNIGAGVDALLALPGLPPALPIVRLEGAGMAEQMAEYVLHAVLRHYRGFDLYQQSQREGAWRRLRPARRGDFPVGIVGLGALGAHVGRTLAALGFEVHGYSRSGRRTDGLHCHGGADGWLPFLRASRILVLLAPLTEATRGLIDAAALAQLRRPGYLINVARGALVVESDLLAALDAGQLAGAALDVFATEPLPAGHPFWNHPRIALTPHVAAVTLRDESIEQIAGKLRALEQGLAISGIVDRAAGY